MRFPATNYYRSGSGARDSAAGPGPKFFQPRRVGLKHPPGRGNPGKNRRAGLKVTPSPLSVETPELAEVNHLPGRVRTRRTERLVFPRQN